MTAIVKEALMYVVRVPGGCMLGRRFQRDHVAMDEWERAGSWQ